jgi:hypothetical protein
MDDKNLRRYDRDLLLSSTKRNQVIELWEVEKFEPEAVSLYDMTPSQWYARGVRILARTTLEAVRDPLGRSIGQDVARIATSAPPGAAFGVIDPFAGSCNALFWIVRQLQGAGGLGFEFEQAIFEMSTRNIASLNAPIRLVHGDYRTLMREHRFSTTHRIMRS